MHTEKDWKVFVHCLTVQDKQLHFHQFLCSHVCFQSQETAVSQALFIVMNAISTLGIYSSGSACCMGYKHWSALWRTYGQLLPSLLLDGRELPSYLPVPFKLGQLSIIYDVPSKLMQRDRIWWDTASDVWNMVCDWLWYNITFPVRFDLFYNINLSSKRVYIVCTSFRFMRFG